MTGKLIALKLSLIYVVNDFPKLIMTEPAQNQTVPIWHRPGWITAMGTMLSLCLTVPGIVGDYLTKLQDIELAKEKTEAVRLSNLNSKQDQEFTVVNNTLAKQGTERIFVLRYLAATLDDEDAKDWAQGEVNRLDELAARQQSIEQLRNQLKTKETELKNLKETEQAAKDELLAEIRGLNNQLSDSNAKLEELQRKAGVEAMPSSRPGGYVLALFIDWSKFEGTPSISFNFKYSEHVFILGNKGKADKVVCSRINAVCFKRLDTNQFPKTIKFDNSYSDSILAANVSRVIDFDTNTSHDKSVYYMCKGNLCMMASQYNPDEPSDDN